MPTSKHLFGKPRQDLPPGVARKPTWPDMLPAKGRRRRLQTATERPPPHRKLKKQWRTNSRKHPAEATHPPRLPVRTHRSRSSVSLVWAARKTLPTARPATTGWLQKPSPPPGARQSWPRDVQPELSEDSYPFLTTVPRLFATVAPGPITFVCPIRGNPCMWLTLKTFSQKRIPFCSPLTRHMPPNWQLSSNP
jgi:hypothetical protein